MYHTLIRFTVAVDTCFSLKLLLRAPTMLEYFRMVTKKSKKKEDSDTDDEDVLFPTRNTSKG